jgi:hypothetical protein
MMMASGFALNPIAFRRNSGRVVSQKIQTAVHLSSFAEDGLSRFVRFGRSKKKEDDGAIHMTFSGQQNVVTDPVSFPGDSGDSNVLDDYFSIDEYRQLLFPNNDATLLGRNISPELFQRWCKEAEVGGKGKGPIVKSLPNNVLQLDDSINEKVHLMKISAKLQMPNLQVTSETIIGVKLLLSRREMNRDLMPELQFTLLDSKLVPEGGKTVKWIFDQIMKYRDSTSSFTQVTAKRVDNDNIVFVTDARLETRIHIPKGILKYLPSVNVEKFEEQGSASIQKLLEKDLEPALVSFAGQFSKEKARLGSAALRP